MGGGRASRKRFEDVVEEPVEDTEDIVADEWEKVGSTSEPVEEEVVAPVGLPYSGLDDVWLLPSNTKALESIIRREAMYAECLVELRRRLRELGELDEYRLREIERELRYVRARLRELAAYLASITNGCRGVGDEELLRLCSEAQTAKSWSLDGASNPANILILLRRYLPHCYSLVVGEEGGDRRLRALRR